MRSSFKIVAFLLLGTLLCAVGAAAEEGGPAEPALPPGLGGEKEQEGEEGPALPPGLDGAEPGAEEGREGMPALPEGLGAPRQPPEAPEKAVPAEKEPLFEVSGFWESRLGLRTQGGKRQEDLTMAETRLQLELSRPALGAYLRGRESAPLRSAGRFLERRLGTTGVNLKADFILDGVAEDRDDVRLKEGRGWVDLRSANLTFSPARFADVRVGRQVLTWGTGDLIFLNDLFPKDWVSFFIGRDVEYLKAPSEAVRVSLYGRPANLDIVYTPRFDPDRFLTARRLSFFDDAAGRRIGDESILDAEVPDSWGQDEELALRLHRNVSGYELAAYAYRGFWKSPAGRDPATGEAIFPGLNAYGASVRGPLGDAIANAEVAYYDSFEDGGGTDTNVRNSELRLLLGYEREMAKNLTMGLQYYLEYMLNYGAYERNLPAGALARDRDRHVLTLRLTQLLWNQNLELSLFTFYSPSDNDAYMRPRAHYDVTDRWSVEMGGHVFTGARRHTFFNQFDDNNSVYAAVRYSF